MSLSLISNPPPWPHGARCAVCFSFDMDVETLLHLYHRDTARSRLVTSSAFRYEPSVAIPRLIKIWKHFNIRQTVFIPGWAIETYPHAVEALVEAGHEIGHHGWLHERPNLLSRDAEERVLDRALAAFDKVVGRRPVGYRAPAYALSEHTVGLLIERGFGYDASLMGDDVPYMLESPRGSLVEIPSDFALDDWMQYVNLEEFGCRMPIRAPQRAMEVFQAEFDAAWAHGGLWISVWHPFVSGRLARADAMVHLIEYMVDKGGVWFAPMGEIAAHVRHLTATGAWTPRVDQVPFWNEPVDHLVTMTR
ncbi:polysaccharide deacetylase family protein [Microvirga roseola]|uniref:polysaccharide deacetylase family protein n=1 Tax=Microvirga roseola TaxID=2883126 RepID=UPI001E4A06C1|nr:polysaccharide deacetylase [Microvirga roseola]